MTTEPSPEILKRALSNCDSEVRRLEAENARLRAALTAAPRWVSVTERPGPEGEGCIALLDNGNWVPAIHINGWRWRDSEMSEWLPLTGVTHWLELPPAPEAKR